MFSHLTRGYGTWQGIAKLEKPDSAVSASLPSADLILPPINQGRPNLFEQSLYDHRPYHIPPDNVKLPKVSPRDADTINIPKTYTTKSGALLLYTEGCFVPGSRRMKKRPRRKRKEKKLHTLKDLAKLIMDYKKNECDPLLLEQLWDRVNSGRDLRPGFSPHRYLTNFVKSTSLGEDTLRRLLETGSLKSFGTMEESGSFLPFIINDSQVNELLRDRPQPYTTMSLPPVSPSSSMLGSFTFYRGGMSTGAASMVSMGSVNGDSMDDYDSANIAGTYIDSLSERLGEVDYETGFKRSYESLSPKEKEDLLTQLLMDVTLHNAAEFAQEMPHNTPEDSSAPETTLSSLGVSSKPSSSKMSQSSTSKRSKSTKTFNSLKSDSKSSVFSSVCSLPPIVPSGFGQDVTAMVAGENFVDVNSEEDQFDKSSSSGSGLNLTQDDLVVELGGINIELVDDSIGLEETEKAVLNRKETDESLLSNISQYSLVGALEIQDGDEVHEYNDEVKSLKSLEGECTNIEEDGMVIGTDLQPGTLGGGDGDEVGGGDEVVDGGEVVGGGEVGGGEVGGGEVGGGGGEVGGGGGVPGADGVLKGDDYGVVGEETGGGDVDGVSDGNIAIVVPSNDNADASIVDDHTKETNDQTVSNSGLQIPHISLSNLHDEVKLVAGAVLSRPKSGRIFAEDAKAATALLMGRIEGLLGPVMTENIRVSSANPKKLRPLGQPRNSEVNKQTTFSKTERTKSAGPTLASRSYADLTDRTAEAKERKDENKKDLVKSIPVEEQLPEITANAESSKEVVQEAIELDDIVVNTDDIKYSEAQLIREEKLETSTPAEAEFLTVKDLKSNEQPTNMEEEPKRANIVKDKKGTIKKQVKSKKGVTGKKGNVAKGKGKKKSNTRSQVRPEPSKTPPFRAGVVPQPKAPKGLDVKADEDKTKVVQKPKSGDEATKSDIEQLVEPKEGPDEQTNQKHVDSETGEAERRSTTPSEAEKTSSTLHVMTSTENASSLSGELLSSRMSTPFSQNETTSVSEKTPSEKTVTPHDKAPSPREKTPSPREEVSPEVPVVDESGTPEREPSPEVAVVNERTKRANARAAQRAAAAERRRQEVERKRREREEARRKAIEEEARLEQLRLEAEEEMKKRDEERRIQKEKEEAERCCLEAEEKERAQKERAAIERQRRARDEWTHKKDKLFAQRKLDEEMRLERERIERELEEEQEREYEARIAHLAIEEQERLLKERRDEEERIKREIEEEKRKREEERQRMLEERRRVEEELEMVRERQLARQLFLESLWKEYQDILLNQRTSRAFTFSYFDYLPWFKERWSDLDERPESSSVLSVRAQTEEATGERTP